MYQTGVAERDDLKVHVAFVNGVLYFLGLDTSHIPPVVSKLCNFVISLRIQSNETVLPVLRPRLDPDLRLHTIDRLTSNQMSL